MGHSLAAGICIALYTVSVPAPDQEITYIDLKPKANQKLTDDFHSGNFAGNNLKELPKGKQTFAGVKFQIEDSLIQLGSELVKDKPKKVEGIKVDRAFSKLHILHATGYSNVEDGTVIGKYVVNYDDKTEETIEIVYGQDVRDWWVYESLPKDLTRGKVAWEGNNEAAKNFEGQKVTIALYLTSWKNPKPNKKVISIDYVSTMTKCAPFCVAMTAEK